MCSAPTDVDQPANVTLTFLDSPGLLELLGSVGSYDGALLLDDSGSWKSVFGNVSWSAGKGAVVVATAIRRASLAAGKYRVGIRMSVSEVLDTGVYFQFFSESAARRCMCVHNCRAADSTAFGGMFLSPNLCPVGSALQILGLPIAVSTLMTPVARLYPASATSSLNATSVAAQLSRSVEVFLEYPVTDSKNIKDFVPPVFGTESTSSEFATAVNASDVLSAGPVVVIGVSVFITRAPVVNFWNLHVLAGVFASDVLRNAWPPMDDRHVVSVQPFVFMSSVPAKGGWYDILFARAVEWNVTAGSSLVVRIRHSYSVPSNYAGLDSAAPSRNAGAALGLRCSTSVLGVNRIGGDMYCVPRLSLILDTFHAVVQVPPYSHLPVSTSTKFLVSVSFDRGSTWLALSPGLHVRLYSGRQRIGELYPKSGSRDGNTMVKVPIFNAQDVFNELGAIRARWSIVTPNGESLWFPATIRAGVERSGTIDVMSAAFPFESLVKRGEASATLDLSINGVHYFAGLGSTVVVFVYYPTPVFISARLVGSLQNESRRRSDGWQADANGGNGRGIVEITAEWIMFVGNQLVCKFSRTETRTERIKPATFAPNIDTSKAQRYGAFNCSLPSFSPSSTALVRIAFSNNGVDYTTVSPGHVEYLPCQLGWVATTYEDPCRLCGVGVFSNNASATTCDHCGEYSYQDEIGGVSCKSCPSGARTTADAARVSRSECLCAAGTFILDLDDPNGCVRCPAQAVCKEGDPFALPYPKVCMLFVWHHLNARIQ